MEGAGKWDEVIRWLENKEDFERDMVEGIRDTNADLSGPLRVSRVQPCLPPCKTTIYPTHRTNNIAEFPSS